MGDALRLTYAFCRKHGVALESCDNRGASLILREDANPAAIAEVRRAFGLPVSFKRVSAQAFDNHLSEAFSNGDSTAADVLADVGQDVDIKQLMTELPAVSDLLETQDDAPIIRMINALLTQAVREGASDIHIEPYERHSAVRLRRDGILHDIAHPHRGLHAAMASRIKIMASLDIAEKRLPQDGRIGLRVAGRQIDLRVSTLPTTHGERIVLRILDRSGDRLGLDRLGMGREVHAEFAQLLTQPHGIVLVTGPTGSGKSTTLYAAIQGMDAARQNIVTVEDPVEYDLPGVGQIHANPKIGLSFAKALRAILRQDPDIIMIGEIRDLETAQIAVQASLTGHLVLATLHTNDTASAVTRLIDMGVEPFLLASTLRGVLAQRLVRVLCEACKCRHVPVTTENALLGADAPEALWQAAGCPACKQTGYAGRRGIYELLTMDETLARLVHDRSDEASIRAHARDAGMQSLREDGMRHVRAGITSLEELIRVTRD